MNKGDQLAAIASRLRAAAVVVCLCSLLQPSSSRAETEAPAARPQQTPAAVEQDAMPDVPPQPGFTPSERISADQAVAFPVDI
jgi:hypothetical protein